LSSTKDKIVYTNRQLRSNKAMLYNVQASTRKLEKQFDTIRSDSHISYLCTYDLYGPVHNVFDACRSITRASDRGLGPGNQDFFGPYEMASSR
jgi:hypothetical protein